MTNSFAHGPLAPSSPQLATLLADNHRSDRRATRDIALGVGAVQAVGPYFKNAFGTAEAVVISDEHTLHAAAEATEASLIAAGVPTRRLVLEPRPGDDHLVAEDGIVLALQTLIAASPTAHVVAVGAGSVNDIGKYASFKVGRPYLAVPTAASMNGYTSTIAALLVGGVKRTLPCDQPVAIFADTAVLEAAPSYLNRAGFGDLLSKPVSQGDWILSNIVRDVPYATRPNDILEALFAELLHEAAAVGRGDRHGLTVLMEAILVSGFSMAVAGSSAPASGGEHLVSHYWDMEELDHGRPLLGLHGTQVGIATRLSAMLFARLLAVDPATIDPVALAARRGTKDDFLVALRREHARLSPGVIGEIEAQILRKQKFGDELVAELTRVKDRWSEITQRISAATLPVATIEKALREAGCVDRPSAIGCDAARAIHTLRVCRHLRDRYCALDLIDDLGFLDTWAAQAVTTAEAN